jgi:hypothetical protein
VSIVSPIIGAPLDIDALEREAAIDGEDCVVTRQWLRQALKEIRQGRAASAMLAHERSIQAVCFGLQGTERR